MNISYVNHSSNCGNCTATETLNCNTSIYSGGPDGIRDSICTCENPNSITITQVFNGTTDTGTSTYNVNVDELTVSDSSEGTYLEVIQNINPNLDIQTVYQVDVTTQDSLQEPFNGKYSNEVATVTFTVNSEVGQGLMNDELGVVHVNTSDGTLEEFKKETTETENQHATYSITYDGTSTYTLSINSNSYSPILIVNLSHTHNYSSEYQKDETQHYHVCECGSIDYKSLHEYDNDQDSSCNTCGYIRTVSHVHTWNDTYSSNETEHYHSCSDSTCVERNDVASHSFGEWNITKVATETSNGSKERVCTVCNYLQTETIEKLTHTHKFGEWVINANEHYHECSCGEAKDYGTHVYTDDADDTCNTCGYKRNVEIKKGCSCGGSVSAIVLVSTLCLGALIIIKKENA